jgi:anthranilate synthase component 1
MFVKTFIKRISFTGDPLAVFLGFSLQNREAALFESPIGAGRRAERSFLFIRHALRLTANDRTVHIVPVSDEGRAVQNGLAAELQGIASVEETSDGLTAVFPPRMEVGSDRDRIKAPSAADALRILLTKQLGNVSDVPIRMPGIFSYDFLEQIESLPPPKTDSSPFPDYVFWLPEVIVILNHVDKTAEVIRHCYTDNLNACDWAEAETARIANELLPSLQGMRMLPPTTAGERLMDDVTSDMDDEAYQKVVEVMKGHIIQGDVFQIVPSRTFSIPCPDPTSAYNALRHLNPSPYLFLIKGRDFTLFGASPEACVRVLGNPKKVEIHPIAGTRPRGKLSSGEIDHDLDNRLEAELRLDKKELAEHMMLVDLARNDVARISKPGTRRVKQLSIVERYSHVMHLVSVVEGELEEELDQLHAYLASMNMGTLVGAPKIEAAKLLRKYEADKRGVYGGAAGFISSSGEMETCIIIRSAIVKDGVARIRAGAGIVYDSDPVAEAAETKSKAGAVIRAIRIANGGVK